MNVDKKNKLEENIESITIAVITESGKVAWVISGDPTKKQIQQFQKIFAVTHNPSIVMKVMLLIEITILKLINSFEIFYKGDEH